MMPAANSRLQRRSFLGLGLAGGLSLWQGAASAATRPARAKNVLIIYEQGGLSHLDTWDPKPEVPVDHRSPHQPIATNVPGLIFTELLAKTSPRGR